MRNRTVVLAVLFCFARTALAEPQVLSSVGRLCVASVPTPTAEPKALANPAGGNPDVEYSVKIGGNSDLVMSRDRGVWIENLNLDRKYPIVIFEDGERTASFFLKLTEDNPSQCLFLSPFYLTWQLWPMKQAGNWCDCG